MIRPNRFLAVACLFLILFQFFSPILYAGTELNDYEGHWAESDMNHWTALGVSCQNQYGAVRLNDGITRAEYSRLMNQVFGFTTSAESNYPDVPLDAWYAGDLLVAKEAGYYLGDEFGLANPEKTLTRQDAFLALNRILSLDSADASPSFSDLDTVSDYALASITTFSNLGYLTGYSDGTVRPTDPLSWGEAVNLLAKAVSAYYPHQGSYADKTIEGNVVVSSGDVTLKNTTINGNLYLTEGIGSSEVYLENVLVTGEIFIQGGGENSIYFQDVTSPRCTVKKKDGQVRLVAKGRTDIDDITLQSGVTLEEDVLERGHTGFLNASITGEIPLDDQINLSGEYDSIIIASTSRVKLDNCKVNNIEIKEALEQDLNDNVATVLEIISSSIGSLLSEAKGAKIALSNASRINNMTITSKMSMTFSDDSTIDKLDIKAGAGGTTLDGKGTIGSYQTAVDDFNLNGKKIPRGTVSSFGPGSSSSGGSSGSSTDSPRTLSADTTDNNYGESVVLTIENNNGFSANISEVTIDGRPVPLVSYTVGSNTVTIDADIFSKKSVDGHSYTLDTSSTPATGIIEQEYMTYAIVVKSSGYDSLSTSQILYTANDVILPITSMAVYYEVNSSNASPVDTLEEIVIGESKQYHGIYKVDDGNQLLLNADEVTGGTAVYSIDSPSIASLSDTGLVSALTIGETVLMVVFNDTTFQIPLKTGYEPPSLSKDTSNAIEGQPIDLIINEEDALWQSSITSVVTNDTEALYQVNDDTITVTEDAFTSPTAREYRYEDNDAKKTIDGTVYDTVYEHVYGKTEVAVNATDYVSSKVWQDVYMTSELTTAAAVEMSIYTSHSDDDLILGKETTNQLYANLILENGRYVKPGYPTWISNYYDKVNHEASNLSIQWHSSDESIATVDDSGEVTALSKGSATITATYKNTSAEKVLTINEPAITISPVSGITSTSASISFTIDDSDWLDNLNSIYLLDSADNSAEAFLMDSADYTPGADSIAVDVSNLVTNYPISGEVVVYLPVDNTVIKSYHELYTFLMTSEFYEDTKVIQPIDYGLENIVTLESDIESNQVGNDIQVAYIDTLDDYDFGNTIVSISINGTDIPISKFTVDSGSITFDGDIFTNHGAYDIEVTAVDVDGIFGLDTYSLTVTQVVTPATSDTGVAYFLDGNKIYGIYDSEDVTTSAALYIEALGKGDYYAATYSSTTTTGSSLVVTYDLPTTLTADDYIINNREVIALATTESALNLELYASLYNLESNTDITYTTDGALTIVFAGDDVPDGAEPLDEGDAIEFRYMGQIVITYKWMNGKWIVE